MQRYIYIYIYIYIYNIIAVSCYSKVLVIVYILEPGCYVSICMIGAASFPYGAMALSCTAIRNLLCGRLVERLLCASVPLQRAVSILNLSMRMVKNQKGSKRNATEIGR